MLHNYIDKNTLPTLRREGKITQNKISACAVIWKSINPHLAGGCAEAKT